MKMSNLVNPSFLAVAKKLLSLQLPMKTAFKLRSVMKKVDEFLEDYEETRVSYIKKYAELNQDGSPKANEHGMIVFKNDDSQSNFMKEWGELLETEVEIDKLKLEDFGDKIQISVEELSHIEGLFE